VSIDFKAMVSELRAISEERVRAEEEKRRQENEYHQGMIRQGKEILNQNIVPLLQQAKEGLLSEGVPADIRTFYEISISAKRYYDGELLYVMPAVRFSCIDLGKFNKRGLNQEPKSISIFFMSDGSGVKLGTGKHADSTHPDNEGLIDQQEDYEPLVSSGVRRAIESYFQDIYDIKLRAVGG